MSPFLVYFLTLRNATAGNSSLTSIEQESSADLGEFTNPRRTGGRVMMDERENVKRSSARAKSGAQKRPTKEAPRHGSVLPKTSDQRNATDAKPEHKKTIPQVI